jgi:hypothetical protein
MIFPVFASKFVKKDKFPTIGQENQRHLHQARLHVRDHQIRDRLDDPCHLGQVRLPDQRPQGQDLLEDRNRHQKQIMGGGRNTRL